MGAVPARILVRRTWFPPDVTGVRGYSGKRPWRSRHRNLSLSILRQAQRSAAQLRADRDEFAAQSSTAILAPEAFCRTAPVGNDRSPPIVRWAARRIPTQLAAAAATAGCVLALPFVVDRARRFVFSRWQPGAPLVAGPFGLRQPAGQPGSGARRHPDAPGRVRPPARSPRPRRGALRSRLRPL